ncbi:MAG: hypothetical protein DWQ01_04545 [Planctomycetota bacterium]|nr:MAG: hypothetical protein DWQ01_04545 [Planctomycetota bacterium]
MTVQLIAHRGCSSLAPENTLAAVEAALQLAEVDFVEVDVHRSRDGVLVAIHDRDLQRTTNGHGLVSELDFADLKPLHAGYPAKFQDRFLDQGIPTLEEVLEFAEKRGAGVMVEVKPAGIGADVAELLCRRKAWEHHFIASEHAQVLEDARRYCSKLRLMPVAERPQEGIRLALQLPTFWIAFDNEITDRETLQAAIQEGLIPWVWTVNDISRAKQLIAWGAKGLITDVPQELNRAEKGKA